MLPLSTSRRALLWVVGACPCIAAFVSPRTALGESNVTACLDAAEQGQTLRDSGAYLRARDRFVACAGDECPGEVRKRCVDWLGDVEKLLPTVVFGAQQGTGEVADVRVFVDGALAAERLDGKPFAVDPGEHRFRFEREGAEAVETTGVVLAGQKQRRISVRFGPEPLAAAPLASPSESLPPPPNYALVYSLGAIAVASLAAGAALDISGFVFVQQCGDDSSCSRNHEIAEANWRFVTGDILLGIGAVSALAAWLLSPSRHAAPTSPAVALDIIPSRTGTTLGLVATF